MGLRPPDTPLDAVWAPPRALRLFRARRITDSELAELVRSGRSFYVTSAEMSGTHAWLRVEFSDVGDDAGMMRLWAQAPRTVAERRELVDGLQRGLAGGGRVGPCRLGKRRTLRGPAVLDLEPAE